MIWPDGAISPSFGGAGLFALLKLVTDSADVTDLHPSSENAPTRRASLISALPGGLMHCHVIAIARCRPVRPRGTTPAHRRAYRTSGSA